MWKTGFLLLFSMRNYFLFFKVQNKIEVILSVFSMLQSTTEAVNNISCPILFSLCNAIHEVTANMFKERMYQSNLVKEYLDTFFLCYCNMKYLIDINSIVTYSCIVCYNGLPLSICKNNKTFNKQLNCVMLIIFSTPELFWTVS
jgi:hypothetical protein